MKALKDSEWEVELNGGGNWGWTARFGFEECGIDCECSQVFSWEVFATEQSAKRNWEKFAKINKIKKWKYV